MSKRGQITVFIIIGIVVLFIFAGVLYLSKMVVEEEIVEEGEPVIGEVPSEFAAIKSFTENCLYSVGKKGLLVLGQQGGYIYPELLGEFSVSKPTDSMGINLEPAKIPYWHYNVESNKENKISLASLQPELYYEDDPEFSIEAQLGRFVDVKLDDCLEDYAAFEEQGFEVEKEEKKTEVTIGSDTVSFLLKMPLEARKGGAESEMELFYVKLPLDLKHYYEIAGIIAEAERNYSFLEQQALDLIQVFSAVDVNKLPPTSAVTFELVPTVYWSALEVKEKISGMLISYIPMLRFLGSQNFLRYEYPITELSGLYQKNYDNMILPLIGGEDLEVNFDYFGWPFYFDVNSKGDTIGPQHTAVHYWMLHFGTQHYYTVYDLSYPVLVTLKDPLAFDGEGYTFVFALESNIRNNKPVEDEDILPAPVAAFSESMVCDEDKFNTGLLKTVVVDSFTGEPVELVQIGFSIPEQDDCLMGLTDFSGGLESRYPAVYGGVMNFIKTDYLTNFYPIDTYQYKENPGIIGYAISDYPSEVIEMHKFKKIKATIKKKNLEKCIDDSCFFSGLLSGGEEVYTYKPELLDSEHQWVFSKVTKPLKETEQAIITLIRIGDLNEEIFNEEFTTSIAIISDGEQEIELVPGIYEVSGNLILNEEVVIPEEERCSGGVMEAISCWDVDGCCFTIDETRMEKFMSGQIAWDSEKSYLRITPEDLYPANELTFYILNQNIENVPVKAHERVIEDLQVMGEMGSISKMADVRRALEPMFS
jgi:hypothetical protein